MTTQTRDLFLIQDLEDSEKTGGLSARERSALRQVGDWIESFITQPHAHLGRSGPICPFVPGALDRNTLWLAAETIGDRGPSDLVDLMNDYRRRLLQAEPIEGEGVDGKVIVVVFVDLPADRAADVFGGILDEVAAASYVDEGIVFGPFYEGNDGTAIYNSEFRPFQSPVPFVFVRHGVVSDWKFFLDDDDWFGRWAERYGAAGAAALREPLRRLPWREHPSH